jgi:5-formyltetrahydrofolate cyclo-ligase
VDKKEARAEIKRRLRKLSAEEKARKSAVICDRVMRLPEWRGAKVVMLFATMPEEVDTGALFTTAFAEGKRVVAPRCVTAERRILPVLMRGMSDLAPGAYEIMEPVGAETAAVEEIDFVLVPGYGFDREGNRLGKGAGYYDKFMSQPGFRAARCAVAFWTQILDEVPHDPYDLPVQILVTETEILRFGP